MKLAVGIPSNGDIKSETVSCLVQTLFNTRLEGLGLIFPSGCLVHENRIAIAQEALAGDFTHLMCIDSDMSFESDAINRLAIHDKDIVGANYHKRLAWPPQDTVLHSYNHMPDKIFKCDGLALGFVLIKVDVFAKIKPPWFFFQDLGNNAFMGEDYWFCQRAKEAGYDIWCDPTIKIDHIGTWHY